MSSKSKSAIKEEKEEDEKKNSQKPANKLSQQKAIVNPPAPAPLTLFHGPDEGEKCCCQKF